MSGDDRKRAIFAALMDLGEAFLPQSGDRPEIAERRRQLAELREQSEQIPDGTISDAVMIEALWSGLQLYANGLHRSLDLAEGALDYAEELETTLDHITGARTRANIRRGEALRERVTELRRNGEKVDYIARLLNITPRHVTDLTPEELKGRR